MPTSIATNSSSAAANAGLPTNAGAAGGVTASSALPAKLNASFAGMVTQSGRSTSPGAAVAPIGTETVQAQINAI